MLTNNPGPWQSVDRVIRSANGGNVAGLVPSRMSAEVRRIVLAAPDLLAACQRLDRRPEHGGTVPWKDNAAITDDIEALRAICLAFADAWNNHVMPAIAKATGNPV